MVVIETHGEHSGQCVIGHETKLEGCVSAACSARHRGNVAADTCLTSVTDVET